MIETLHIENIAVIKSLDVDFTEGFHILTGETGAGKSIVIDSIELLLGGKADKDLIRNGEKNALVSATFCGLSSETLQLLRSFELLSEADPGESESIMIQRTLSQDGRSSARFCGKPITIAMLKEIGSSLMTIHGQNDNGQLLKKSAHLDLLDAYADSAAILNEYAPVYDDYRRVCLEEAEYRKNESEKERLFEILSYQLRDIDSAKLRVGEEEALLAERNQLQYAEKIAKSTDFCYRALKGSEKGSVLLLIEKSTAALRAIQSILPDAGGLAERLEACKYEIEDIAESASELAETDCDDPTARLNEVEARLDAIHKLERKYGATIRDVLEFREKIASDLEKIEHGSDYLIELTERKRQLKASADILASKLTAHRKAVSKRLEKEIAEVLAFLDMPKVQFGVEILPAENLSKSGKENVEFLISTNPSEPLASLIKIASGGELSRIMLALRSVFLDKESVGTLIFDEIDTGVSGKTSQKIGIKLRALSKNAQVICITHSPQIAALADTHFKIQKNEVNGRNETSLRLLDKNERINEIARILGGIHVTETQKQSAKELIEDGEKF